VLWVCDVKHKSSARETKRVQVTFTADQWALLQRFRGMLGNDDAEIVRNIVLSWLSEKSIIASALKENVGSEK